MVMSFSGELPGRPIPRVPGREHTLRLLRDPYRFIARECRALGSDVVQARLMLRPTLCLSGPRAAELFYDPQRFRRAGAAPEAVRATLFGKGGVQGLDGQAHLQRKAFFMEATAPGQVHALVREATRIWHAMAPRWNGHTFTLYEALQEWLARAACAWAGVPLPAEEVRLRTAQLSALFDKAASGVGAHFAARRARREAQAWLIELIKAHRSGQPALNAQSMAAATAMLRDARGELLPPRIAAVELLNLLRPTVAVSVFIVFVAHAMHVHPDWARKLREATAEQTLAFVQEVRRFYPFFPAVTARVAVPFVWEGYRFPQGMRAMLDLYGTNHDPRAWGTPDEFRPERFMGAAPARPFAFVPQGGGRAEDHHRCPGESITVELMLLAARLLARECRYRVPEQHLWIQMGRMPALPASRFIVTDFQATTA